MTTGRLSTETAGGVLKISSRFSGRHVFTNQAAAPRIQSLGLTYKALTQCETYEIEPRSPTHGDSGPLKVSWGGFYMEVGKEFLDVGAKYDKARGATEDSNGLFECNKYGVSLVLRCSLLALLNRSEFRDGRSTFFVHGIMRY